MKRREGKTAKGESFWGIYGKTRGSLNGEIARVAEGNDVCRSRKGRLGKRGEGDKPKILDLGGDATSHFTKWENHDRLPTPAAGRTRTGPSLGLFLSRSPIPEPSVSASTPLSESESDSPFSIPERIGSRKKKQERVESKYSVLLFVAVIAVVFFLKTWDAFVCFPTLTIPISTRLPGKYVADVEPRKKCGWEAARKVGNFGSSGESAPKRRFRFPASLPWSSHTGVTFEEVEMGDACLHDPRGEGRWFDDARRVAVGGWDGGKLGLMIWVDGLFET
ncbi:hypothetical protein NL676_001216 [Syzygium grande]|nr:hypothetical protein NL676_001216 [Syzygium grande]